MAGAATRDSAGSYATGFLMLVGRAPLGAVAASFILLSRRRHAAKRFALTAAGAVNQTIELVSKRAFAARS